MFDDQTSSNNGVSYGKEELVDNLKILLKEHSEGIRLTTLEDAYKTKFSKSLLSELIKLALPDVYSNFASIIPEEQKNGLSDSIIALKDEEDNNQIQDQSLREITETGIVSKEFGYTSNPFVSNNNNQNFTAFVSNIAKYHPYVYIQPEYYIQYMEKLTEELDIYYSHPISEQLLVKDIMVDLACVSRFEGVYHRAHISGNRPSTCMITYVDIGLTEEIEKTKVQLKYLLNYFATFPCMAIACRLADIEFKLNNFEMPLETYQQLNVLSHEGPFVVEPYGQVNDILSVKIYDAGKRCLNDILVEQRLAFETTRSTTIATRNGGDLQKTQHIFSSVNSKQKQSNDIDETNRTSATTAMNQKSLMDDYVTDNCVATQLKSTRISNSNTYGDYDAKNSLPTSIKKSPTISSTTKSGTQSDKKKFTDIKNSNSTNQFNRQDRRRNDDQMQLSVTINRDMPGSRLFTNALSFLPRNKVDNQRQVSRSPSSIIQPKKDEFASWMCSWAIEKSLWSSDTYRNALLKYIGKIYKQNTHMYRYFAQLKSEMAQLDELDLLNRLIENTQQRRDAQMSFDKWKDNSRIGRRLEDLKVIFEFNGDYKSTNHPFNITPSGLQQIVDRQKIKSYFDLGCGDGTITAGIGAYLGLSKANIFGGDIFEGQTNEITFIKVNENESTIALPDNHVDLITSFVTFHHVSQVNKTVSELSRILRPGGYLILREHDCRNEHSLSAKYLNFVHAIMMIAGVGEFAGTVCNHNDINSNAKTWPDQKSHIIEYTKTIHYRTCDEWKQELGNVGFSLRATLYYGTNVSNNPQKLFYAVYQLTNK